MRRLLAILAGVAMGALWAPARQAPTAPALKFDVASVREWAPHQGPTGRFTVGVLSSPGRIFSQCANLRSLVYYAYHITPPESMAGLPSWGDAVCADSDSPDTFAIEATMPAGTTDAQARAMMQSLLADRFHLAAHWQTRQTSVLRLEIAPGGFKLQPSDPAQDAPLKPHSVGCPPEDPHCHMGVCCGSMQISTICGWLMRETGKPVIDKTGLTGYYPFGMPRWAGDDATASPLPSSLPALLRDQYGLVMKPGVGPVRVLVIDHVGKLSSAQ